MLILDQIHQRMHNHLPDETTLANGQKFELLSLALLGVPSMSDAFNELTGKLSNLKFDTADYVCLKFILLLSPGKYLFIFIFSSRIDSNQCRHSFFCTFHQWNNGFIKKIKIEPSVLSRGRPLLLNRILTINTCQKCWLGSSDTRNDLKKGTT